MVEREFLKGFVCLLFCVCVCVYVCVWGGDQRVVYAKLRSIYSYSIYFGLRSELELTASKENGHNSGCCLAFLSSFLQSQNEQLF